MMDQLNAVSRPNVLGGSPLAHELIKRKMGTTPTMNAPKIGSRMPMEAKIRPFDHGPRKF